MAETVASPFLDIVCNRLDSHASILSRSTGFVQIRVKLAEIRALLDEANSDHMHENSSLRRWFSVLTDLAYDVDGVIDNWEESENKKATCSLSSIVNSSKIEHEVKSIHVRLVSLLNLFYKFSPDVFLKSKTISDVGFVRSDQYVVIGRDFEVSNVVNMMVLDNEEDELEIFPIVGMGGIGKTILARRIYNDEAVKSYFQIRVWVSVGEKSLDVGAICQAIEVECGIIRGKGNVVEARGILEGKRFLIVLDDVWDEDGENMEKALSWLNVGGSGSCVLVTTRSGRVASMMGTVPTQHLTCLSSEDSWVLFKHFAFGSVEDESTELEEIGRNIVAKCKGLPIAIKTIGSILHSKDKEEWLSVADCDLWTLLEFKSHVLPVLKRSYDNLPWHLKQCFAYCSIFPKDYWINKEKLVRLWVAEGFIRLDSGSEDLEETADDYFMELLQHSFFDNIVRGIFGEVVMCKVHEYMHCLAQLAAGVEYSIVSIRDSQNIHTDIRHCTLVGDLSSSTIPRARKLRTLLFLTVKMENLSFPCQEFQCLRVLDLGQSGIIKLPDSIGTLKHLRYLDLSHTYIRKIPGSISKLKHLQTLDLSNCYNLEELPKGICQLTNLRTLDISSCYSLIHMPLGIGKLRPLRKLPAFILGKQRFCAGLGELKLLDLRGRLEIKNLENLKNVVDAEEAKLHDKVHIRSLGLSWSRNAQMRDDKAHALIEILRPHHNLKVLDLKGYRGSVFPSWLNSGVLNLVKVSLVDCTCQELPPLGQLPNLKDLYVKGMSAVQIIGYKFYGNDAIRGFPSLKLLQLYDMPNLMEWKGQMTEGTDEFDGMQEPFPCLEKLVVEGCRMLNTLPFIRNLKNLALCNSNDKLVCSLSRFPSLSSLVVDNFPELNCLSDKTGNLNSLVKLTVNECDNLESLFVFMQSFSSLRHLSILHCDKLESLPMSLEKFCSLQKLDIVECPRLVHIPDIMGQHSSLLELSIEGCPMLKLSPKSIEFLSQLQRLMEAVSMTTLNLMADEVPTETDAGASLREKKQTWVKALGFRRLKNITNCNFIIIFRIKKKEKRTMITYSLIVPEQWFFEVFQVPQCKIVNQISSQFRCDESNPLFIDYLK